jgi:transcriptional regulator with XRE-family HTH domain
MDAMKKAASKPSNPGARHVFRPLKIRAWRKHRRMTLEALAEKTGLTASYISMLERGQRGYTQETLEAIAQQLQTDVPSLFILDPQRPESLWAWLSSVGQGKFSGSS